MTAGRSSSSGSWVTCWLFGQVNTHDPKLGTAAGRGTLHDRDSYLIVLGTLLFGYALLGKTFAYIGLPPLYVGEVVFALGVIALLYSRCAVASFATLPNLLLALLIGWGIIRTVPYLRENGFDAMRDSMLVLYGGFAFIVTALLLEKPERLQLVIKFLRVLALILVPLAPIIVIMTNAASTPRAKSPSGRLQKSAPPPFTSPRPRCWSFSASNARTFYGALF